MTPAGPPTRDHEERRSLRDLAKNILHDKSAPPCALLAAWRAFYHEDYGNLIALVDDAAKQLDA